MSQITPREPGLVGAALDRSDLHAGLIADGHHVHAANLRLAAGRHDTLMLVTDAMPTVGAADPTFTLQGRRITLSDGRLTDEAGTLAGAHLTMAGAVRTFSTAIGGDDTALATALRCASAHPAAFLGLAADRGTIAPGARADLVALDTQTFAVHDTWIDGVPSSL
jgi:N-acetylglucosamine-6-phosphate deacetylase